MTLLHQVRSLSSQQDYERNFFFSNVVLQAALNGMTECVRALLDAGIFGHVEFLFDAKVKAPSF